MKKVIKILKWIGASLIFIFSTIGGIFLISLLRKSNSTTILVPTIKITDVENSFDDEGLDEAVDIGKKILTEIDND